MSSGRDAGVELLRVASWPDDRPPDQEIKHSPYISEAGHHFQLLASTFPELQEDARETTGIYQALGQEKMEFARPMFETVLNRGFDALRPAALIFRYSPYGAAGSLAVAFHCQGPFFTLEGDQLAGATATLQALTDLARRRCGLALVCSSVGARTQILLLGRRSEGGLRYCARWTTGAPGTPPGAELAELESAMGSELTCFAADPQQDPHGMQAALLALEHAQAGTPSVSWSVTPDGRGMLLALARHGAP